MIYSYPHLSINLWNNMKIIEKAKAQLNVKMTATKNQDFKIDFQLN